MDKKIDKYAVINNGIVENIVIAEEEYALAQGWVKCEDGWSIGTRIELKEDKWQEVIDQKSKILSDLALLDLDVTPRILRQASLGDPLAIQKIKEIEEKAEKLRKELKELYIDKENYEKQ